MLFDARVVIGSEDGVRLDISRLTKDKMVKWNWLDQLQAPYEVAAPRAC